MDEKFASTITCPKCGTKHNAELWAVVDVDKDPALKDKLITGELFRFFCPRCGYRALVNHSFLYRCESRHLFIWYAADEQTFSEACLNMTQQMKASFVLPAGQQDRCRVVASRRALVEKLLIDDSGLDDRVVEIIKVLLYLRRTETEKDVSIQDVVFDRNVENVPHIRFLHTDGTSAVMEIPEKLVRDVERNARDILAGQLGHEPVVDARWANRVINQ